MGSNYRKKDHSFTKVDEASRIVQEEIIMPSTFETIDGALFDYVDESLNIHATTNKGFKKVPVIWTSAERSFQVKNSRALRDKSGYFILPAISIERTSVSKELESQRIFGNVVSKDDAKGGSIVIARRIKGDKTANFARADSLRKKGQLNFPRKNKKIVYQTVSVPFPVYMDMTYSITLRAEYQQQLNEMMTPFIVDTKNFNYVEISKDGHRYETFFQASLGIENNVASLEEEERKYETKIDVKVVGYLMGEDSNEKRPKIVYRENVVEVKLPRERVILGDIPEHIDNEGFYRP